MFPRAIFLGQKSVCKRKLFLLKNLYLIFPIFFALCTKITARKIEIFLYILLLFLLLIVSVDINNRLFIDKRQ